MVRFSRSLQIAVSLATASMVLVGCASSGGGATEMTVHGAASTRVLNDALQELAVELDPPMELTFNNAGSSTLVQQLGDGAPGDVLITADKANMDRAVEDGSAKNPQVVATNSMVMVVPAGNPGNIGSVDDLDGANLVLCDPQVPCGTVSETLIEANDIEVDPISLEHSVSDTLGKVASGEADAGWVYRTDAAAAGDAVEVIDIPRAEEFPNSLVAGVATNTDNPEESQQLLNLIGSEEMASVWEDYGFTPVA